MLQSTVRPRWWTECCWLTTAEQGRPEELWLSKTAEARSSVGMRFWWDLSLLLEWRCVGNAGKVQQPPASIRQDLMQEIRVFSMIQEDDEERTMEY